MVDTSAFERARRFERVEGETFAVREVQFDATVEPVASGYRVRVTMPTIDAAIAEESVPEVVVAGWYETLVRRLDDLERAGMTRTDDVAPPLVERDDGEVRVETEFSGSHPAEDARAIVTYVEGTWFEGLIPGYEYVPEIQATRERDHQQGGGEERTTRL